MVQGWPESQSTTQKIALPEFHMAVAMRDGAFMSSSRQRTSQACDKCRERKTKCSGDRPVCKRCTARGLICTYSCREPRSRGPAKPRPRAASTIELPSVAMHDLKAAAPPSYKFSQVQTYGSPAPHRLIRQQHYRTISLPQQDVLLARGPPKMDLYAGAPVLSEWSSRQRMSHDIRQLQSRRLDPDMSPPTRELQVRPMVRDAGQISPLARIRNVNGLSATSNPTPNPPINNNLVAQLPSSAGLEHIALDYQFQQFAPLQSGGSSDGNTWNCYGGETGHRYVDHSSTPPSLSHSTSTSEAHSPSSSDHDWGAHYQSMGDIERLMASYTDSTFYERSLDISQGLRHISDPVFGCLEPPSLIQPFRVGNEGMLLTEPESSRDLAMLDLQYPTPVTPIGMEKLETVVDSSALV
ncbi:hypothetical protein AX15_006336 [Amanita polypyramis BW_CC]|nr:hypothetical protein AX15_006336 [Amanita polypyramis BW_CC]